ncbi:MAG: regulatory protein RecX [Candidatus Limnocylindrales bacterium]
MSRRSTPAARAEARERRAALADPAPVMDAAARYLEARPRSIAETRARLTEAGYPGPLVDQVLQRMVELGYLDDLAFARAWVESRDRAHPRGEPGLRRELERKGVAREVTETVLAERRAAAPGREPGLGRGRDLAEGSLAAHDRAADRDRALDNGAWNPDAAAARRVLDRRAAGLLHETDPRRRASRAFALLARHGFDPETCRAAIRDWLAELPPTAPGRTTLGGTGRTAAEPPADPPDRRLDSSPPTV